MRDAAVHEFGGTSGIRDAGMLVAVIRPRFGCQETWFRTTAFRMRSNWRVAATSANFLGLLRRHSLSATTAG